MTRFEWLRMMDKYVGMGQAAREAVAEAALAGDSDTLRSFGDAYAEDAIAYVERYAPEDDEAREEEKWRELAESIRLDAQE